MLTRSSFFTSTASSQITRRLSTSTSVSRTSGVAATTSTFVAPQLTNSTRTQMLPGGRSYHRTGPKKASMELAMSPELAEQCNQLAKTAYQTRNLKDALSLYDRVLSYRATADGIKSERYAATLHNIGRVLCDLKNFKGAEQALTEACAIYQELFGEGNLKYADSLGLLGSVYRDLNLFDEAEASFKSALLAYREHVFNHERNSWLPAEGTLPPDQPNESPLSTVAHILADAAMLFMLQDQLDRAAAFLEEALDIRRFLYSKHAKFKPMIAQTLSKLAEIKRALNDITFAEMYINECVEICVETLGRDSPATAAAISSKGNVLAVKQQFVEAKKCYEEAATTYAMAFGKTNPLVGLEMIHIGRMQEMSNDFVAADNSYIKAIEISTQALGADNVQVADALQFRASLCIRKMDHQSAIPMLREAIRIRGAKDTPDPALAALYHKLGDALASLHDPEAEAQFLQAVETHRQIAAFGKTDKSKEIHELMATDVLDDLGLHYVQFKHYDRARECFEEALEYRKKVYGEIHPTIGYSHSNLSVMYMGEEKYDKCEKECLDALAVYEKVTGDTWMAVGDVRMQLGQCYRMMKKYDSALEHLEKALNMRRIKGEVADISCAETLLQLAMLRIDMGVRQEANKHIAEGLQICDKHSSATGSLKSEFVKLQQKLGDGSSEQPQASVPPPGSVPPTSE